MKRRIGVETHDGKIATYRDDGNGWIKTAEKELPKSFCGRDFWWTSVVKGGRCMIGLIHNVLGELFLFQGIEPERDNDIFSVEFDDFGGGTIVR